MVFFLDIRKKGKPIVAGWLLYGILSGAYIRGWILIGGQTGIWYCLTALLILQPLVAVLTGIYRSRADAIVLPYYSSKRRIRDFLEIIHIRLLPGCIYAAALLLCYIIDYEIIKRIQWKLLLRMLGNVIN